MSTVIVSAFGEDYILPRSVINRSRFLQSALSGEYREQNKVEIFDLDSDLKSYLEGTFNYLMTGNYPPITTSDDVIGYLIVADYLDVDIIDYILSSRNLNLLDEDDIIEIYHTLPDHDIRETILNYYITTRTYINDIPEEFRFYLNNFLVDDLKDYQGGPIALRLLPIPPVAIPIIDPRQRNYTAKLMFPGYSRQCQGSSQPEFIQPFFLPQVILAGRHIEPIRNMNNPEDLTVYYITCLSDKYPDMKIKQYNGQAFPCCGKYTQKIVSPYPQGLGNLDVAMTPTGYLVFIPPNYTGDYIFLQNPVILDDYRWIY